MNLTRVALFCLWAVFAFTSAQAQAPGAAGETQAVEITVETNLALEPFQPEPEPEPTMGERIWRQWKAGGNTMYVILFFSLMAGSCLLERTFRCRRERIVPTGLAGKADGLWKERKYDDLVALCEQDGSILAQAIKYIVVHRHNDLVLVSTGAGDVAASELKLHLQRAYPLAIAATLSPLAGLFGTVIGMIESFQIVAVAGSLGDASLLASGISKALVTTAAGLFVAIVSLGFYHYFRSKTNVFGVMIEKQINDLISLWMMRAKEKADPNEN